MVPSKAYLKVRTRDAPGDLPEQRFLDLDKLGRLDHVQDLLDLAEEHHLFLGAGLWPELEQPAHHRFRQRGVLFQELNHAVRELGVVQR